jgi:hypothetical protein
LLFKNKNIKIYRTATLPVVWYVCVRNLIPHITGRNIRLNVFKNRVQKKTTGNKTKEVTGRGTTLQSEELHGCYTVSNIVKVIKSRRMR